MVTVAPSAERSGGRSMCGSPCARCPPSVATLRTRTFDSVRSVFVMTGQPLRTASDLSSARRVVMAPMRRTSFSTAMLSKPRRRSDTRRAGRNTPAFIISMIAVPPDIGRASLASRAATASRNDCGSSSSNGFNSPPPADFTRATLAAAKEVRMVDYDQRGHGPDLLLIHSLLTERSVFDLVLPQLAARYRVTPLNLPGFGTSPPVVLQSVADPPDPVARVMDTLALPKDTTVFGNGFGAFVALELAIGHGKRFGRLIVADTLAAFPEPARAPSRGMAERVAKGGMAAVLDTAIGRMFPPAFAEKNPDIIAARKAALAKVDPQCF